MNCLTTKSTKEAQRTQSHRVTEERGCRNAGTVFSRRFSLIKIADSRRKIPILPSYHFAILPSYHFAILPFCHFAIFLTHQFTSSPVRQLIFADVIPVSAEYHFPGTWDEDTFVAELMLTLKIIKLWKLRLNKSSNVTK
jgi:hypothetical protein